MSLLTSPVPRRRGSEPMACRAWQAFVVQGLGDADGEVAEVLSR